VHMPPSSNRCFHVPTPTSPANTAILLNRTPPVFPTRTLCLLSLLSHWVRCIATVSTRTSPLRPNFGLRTSFDNSTHMSVANVPLDEAVRRRYTFVRRGEDERRLHVPKSAILSAHGISTVGDVSTLAAFVDLDISDNEVRDWSEVGRLLQQQSTLECLDLSANPLAPSVPAALPVSLGGAAHGLKQLVLNGVPNFSWDSVSAILPALPSLQELRLCHNKYGVLGCCLTRRRCGACCVLCYKLPCRC